MLEHIKLDNLLFIDIETVPAAPNFSELSNAMQELWAYKHSLVSKAENETPEDGYLMRAGVYAEFAKIICISMGYFYTEKTGKRILRLKSFSGDNEKELLSAFAELLSSKFNKPNIYQFCGHNIREFDIPFICRRMLVHQITFPKLLDKAGKKPWESQDVDTLQLWKFGDYKHYTSLKLLAELLQIPTPKDQIEGKDVCRVYWQENGLQRIVEYCQKDVATVARLILRFKGENDTLLEQDIVIV